MNEIMQKLLTPNLTTVGVIFGISFVTLVYRLGRLVNSKGSPIGFTRNTVKRWRTWVTKSSTKHLMTG